jgi:hypothetical protein
VAAGGLARVCRARGGGHPLTALINALNETRVRGQRTRSDEPVSTWRGNVGPFWPTWTGTVYALGKVLASSWLRMQRVSAAEECGEWTDT